MLNPEKHCEFLTQHILARSKEITNSFRLFVQMFAALVGGAAAIRLQNSAQAPRSFAWLADALGLLILVATTYLILENLRAWYGYRNRLSDVAGEDVIKRPGPWWTARIEIIMISVMVVASVAFWTFNPLRAN